MNYEELNEICQELFKEDKYCEIMEELSKFCIANEHDINFLMSNTPFKYMFNKHQYFYTSEMAFQSLDK